MSLDFQQIHEQVRQLGENAPGRERRLQVLRQQACALLTANAHEVEALRQKVERIVRSVDPSLRCALPVTEHLDACHPEPPLPEGVSVLAADGSQIFLDHHAPVEYFLINIGTIQMRYGDTQPPKITVESDLQYGEAIDFAKDYPSEERISLLRDLREREKLAELALQLSPPVVTLTDGPLELWGAKGGPDEASRQGLDDYLEALTRLQASGAITAGYEDRPTEDYVIRLLEVASQPDEDARQRPLRGVRDADLFRSLLGPGERSAVFEIQSRFASLYKRRHENLALHFFYLNVGRAKHPSLARVEILGWVAQEQEKDKLNTLHAVLTSQCRTMGTRPYPYLLHRAHETARVTPDEKNQLELMMGVELRKHGLTSEESNKQGLKNLAGKGRYKGAG